MEKRKTDQLSAIEASDSDHWLASFADARHIMRTRFRSGSDLGDGPVRRSGIAAVHQALSCLDLCRDIVGEVTDPDIRQRLSITIELLIENVALSAPAYIAISEPLDLSSNEPEQQVEDDASDDDLLSTNDPVWDEPSLALFKDGDPEPLAKLLLQKLPPPLEVTHMLGRMLLPASGYRGYQLVPTYDKRKPLWTSAALELGKRLKVARRYRELMSETPRKTRQNIIYELMQEFKRQRAWVEEAITFDNSEVFRRSQIMLGYAQEDERD